jgi:tRNA-dihydrouridine synthase
MNDIRPFKIRDIEINPPLVLSPMAGVTDISFPPTVESARRDWTDRF